MQEVNDGSHDAEACMHAITFGYDLSYSIQPLARISHFKLHLDAENRKCFEAMRAAMTVSG